MTSLALAAARALDAADPLARFRKRFAIPDPDLVYLDGNSLGRPPRAVIERVAALGARWATDLIGGWYEPDGWLDLPLRVGDLLARSVLAARPGEVVVGDSTTVNLYRLASAALDLAPARRSVAIARSEFPTDRYVIEGLAAERGLNVRWLDPDPVEGVGIDDIAAVLDDDLALVVLSLVDYRSAAVADLATITALARRAGTLVLWDVSHAAGTIPMDLAGGGAELATGCTYKYLNGGPGAPAFTYIRRDLQDRLRPPIQGWFAQRDQFEMGPRFERRPGIGAWLVGTPGIAGLVAVEAAVELVAEAGIEAIRSKSVGLTAYAVELFDAWLAPLGCELGSPRDPARRGSHIAVRHPAAKELSAELIERHIVVDFREPDVIRVGLSPLTTRFEDVHRGLAALRELVG